eukprot:COSAG02_NODE_519_length_20760_cov_60.588819_10_plen_147_part_00
MGDDSSRPYGAGNHHQDSFDREVSEVVFGTSQSNTGAHAVRLFLRVCGAPPPKSLVGSTSSSSVWYYHFIRVIYLILMNENDSKITESQQSGMNPLFWDSLQSLAAIFQEIACITFESLGACAHAARGRDRGNVVGGGVAGGRWGG